MSVNMKCPTCGGPVYFEPLSGRMRCTYCGRIADTEEFAGYDEERPKEPPKKSGNMVWDEKQGCYIWKLNRPLSQGEEVEPISPEKAMQQRLLNPEPVTPVEETPVGEIPVEETEYMELNMYTCTSCGAELMLSGTEASTFCGFCGSPAIVFDRVSRELRPQKIIPFKITEQQALDCIRKRFQNVKYLPHAIRELSVDKIRGIYMPFWLYECYIRRSMRLEVKVKQSKHTVTKKYYRDASCIYQNVTMDATLKLNNELSQRLEPFDMDELEDFNPVYLSGYYADKFDVPKDAVTEAVQDRCREFLDKAIVDSCPEAYNNDFEATRSRNYRMEDVQEEYTVNKVDYALLPAYFVNLHYKEGTQTVFVNGQTGKVVGNFPVEKEQFIRTFLKTAALSCLILSLICTGFMALIWADNPDSIVFIVVLAIVAAISLANGVNSYKRYKMDLFRMNASNTKSYVNDREERV